MKTKQLTMCSMLCALYGVLLWFNSISGYLFQDYLPFLLSMPILVAALLYPARVSLCALAAMCLMNFLFGSFTTWVYGFVFVLAGWFCGAMRRRGWNAWILFGALSVLLAVLNMLTMTWMAQLFGYDLQEISSAARFVPFLSSGGIILILSAFLGALQSLVILDMMLILSMRLPGIPAARAFGGFHSLPVWSVWVFLLLTCAEIGLWLNVLSWNSAGLDLLSALWLIFYCLMVYQGYFEFLWRHRFTRGQLMLLSLGAFVPGINLVYAVAGAGFLLRQTFKRKL